MTDAKRRNWGILAGVVILLAGLIGAIYMPAPGEEDMAVAVTETRQAPPGPEFP